MVKDGQVAVGHRMKLAFSSEHHISDDAEVERYLLDTMLQAKS